MKKRTSASARPRTSTVSPWHKLFNGLLTKHATKAELEPLLESYARNHESFDATGFLRENAGELLSAVTKNTRELQDLIIELVGDVLNFVDVGIHDKHFRVEFTANGMQVRDLQLEGGFYSRDVEIPGAVDSDEPAIYEKLKKSGAEKVSTDWGFKRDREYGDRSLLVFRVGFTVPIKAEDYLTTLGKLFLSDIERIARDIPTEDWGTASRRKVALPVKSARKSKK